jgi:thioredoxin-like negative regulator of GroEL
VDVQKELAASLNIKVLPTVIGIKNGQVANQFQGMVPEVELDVFFSSLGVDEVVEMDSEDGESAEGLLAKGHGDLNALRARAKNGEKLTQEDLSPVSATFAKLIETFPAYKAKAMAGAATCALLEAPDGLKNAQEIVAALRAEAAINLEMAPSLADPQVQQVSTHALHTRQHLTQL